MLGVLLWTVLLPALPLLKLPLLGVLLPGLLQVLFLRGNIPIGTPPSTTTPATSFFIADSPATSPQHRRHCSCQHIHAYSRGSHERSHETHDPAERQGRPCGEQ